MASVNWEKNKNSNMMGARIAHAKRHDGKEVNYANPDVNLELSYKNYSLNNLEKRTTKQEVERLKKRIIELDKILPPKRVRADRVTSINLNFSTPEWLEENQQRQFYEICLEKAAKMFGGLENLSSLEVHNDEIHDYYDPKLEKRVKSRSHAHLTVIPWTDEKGVNAKTSMTRGNMIKLNNEIDSECLKIFGKGFLTHDSSRHGMKVEELKRESMSSEIKMLDQNLFYKRLSKEQLKKEIEHKNYVINRLQEKTELYKNDIAKLEDSIDRIDSDIDKKIEIIKERDLEIQNKNAEIEALKKKNEQIKKALDNLSFTEKIGLKTAQKIAHIENEKAKELDKKDKEIKDLRQILVERDSPNKQKDEEINRLKILLKMRNNSIDRLENEINSIRNGGQIIELEGMIEDLKMELHSKDISIHNLKEENLNFKIKLGIATPEEVAKKRREKNRKNSMQR